MKEKTPVAILGASGLVGQTFAWLLSDHPLFELRLLCTSERSSGGTYGDRVPWLLPVPLPGRLKERKFETMEIDKLKSNDVRLLFSALPGETAEEIEPKLRESGFGVFSNAGAMRMDHNVPLMIPEVNGSSLALIERQGYPDRGFVVTNANCAVTGLALALAPLKPLGIRQVKVATYQSISGAGYPGLSALEIGGNIVPFIDSEEEKVGSELNKLLGCQIDVSATCVRVPVPFGHLESVWVELDKVVTEDDIIRLWSDFKYDGHALHSVPKSPVQYLETENAPQPTTAFHGEPSGMPVFVGRLETSGRWIRFVLLVNNLVRGAAGGSVANAELYAREYGVTG